MLLALGVAAQMVRASLYWQDVWAGLDIDPKVSEQEIIGEWRTDDATVTFFPDHTFTLRAKGESRGKWELNVTEFFGARYSSSGGVMVGPERWQGCEEARATPATPKCADRLGRMERRSRLPTGRECPIGSDPVSRCVRRQRDGCNIAGAAGSERSSSIISMMTQHCRRTPALLLRQATPSAKMRPDPISGSGRPIGSTG